MAEHPAPECNEGRCFTPWCRCPCHRRGQLKPAHVAGITSLSFDPVGPNSGGES